MPPVLPAATPTEIRALRRSLTEANDAKVMQVVAMLDSLAERGPADALIAPMRGRLAHLRPARKLRFERLLFLPLDPLIVPPHEWKPNTPTIPRNALAPMAGTVRIALRRDMRPIDTLTAGKTTDDVDAIAQAGDLLWLEAGRILAIAPMPMGWTEAGLKPAVYPALARSVAAVLIRLPILQTLFQDASNGLIAPREDTIETLVAGFAEEPTDIQATLIALLLARLPQAGQLMHRIEAMARGQQGRVSLRQASDMATETLLERLETEGGTESQIIGVRLAEAGAESRRLAALLEELEKRSSSADRRSRLKAIGQRLDASCRERFATGLTEELLLPLQATPGGVDRPMQQQLETAARQLRTLETSARKIGSAALYDDLLRQAGSAISSVAPDTLNPARAARLVEILTGSEAAMALLAGAR